MIAALLVLAVSVIFGVSIVSRLEFADSALLKISFGMPFGIAAYAFLELLLYYLYGRVTIATIYAAAAVLAAIAAFAIIQKTGLNARELKKHFIGKGTGMPFMLGIYLLVLYAIVGTLFLVSVFSVGHTLYCEGPGCSDTMYHIGIGNSLLYSSWPPKLYFAYGANNVFPFIYDFFVSMMMKYGLGINAALAVPEQLMVFSFVCLSVLIAYRITGSELKAVMSTVILWFGGTGFVQLLDYPFKDTLSKLLFPIHLLTPPATSGILSGINAAVYVSTDFITYWIAVINTMLIAQRDFMLGLPIGFAVIYLLYIFVYEKKSMSKKEAAFIGVLIGMLPLIHPLTLVVVGVLAVFSIAVYMIISKKKLVAATNSAIAAAAALVIGLPQMLYIDAQPKGLNWFYQNWGGFVIHMHNAFLTALATSGNIIFFWIEVVGLPAVIGIIGLAYAKKRERLLFVPFMALWVLITFMSVTPNPGDENEIFLYVFFILAILSSELLYKLWRSNRIGKVAVVAMLVVICFNALFVVYFDDLHNVQLLESPAEMSAASFIAGNTPEGSVFAVSDYDTFNPVVSTLGSRQTVISIAMYVGGIVTVPPQKLEAANSNIISDGNCSAIRDYNVSYVYLQSSNSSSGKPFNNSNFSVVYRVHDSLLNDNITIYRAYC